MKIANFLIFTILGASNLWVYSYFFKKFNQGKDEYEARETQPMSAITKFIKYFQNFYGPIALIYFGFRNFYFDSIIVNSQNLLVGSSLAISGLLLMIWALRHLRENFSPCHNAKIPQKRILTGPYQYVSHPIYLANFLQFIGITIANPDLFFISALILQIIFYSFAIRDENKALDKKFSSKYRFLNTDRKSVV